LNFLSASKQHQVRRDRLHLAQDLRRRREVLVAAPLQERKFVGVNFSVEDSAAQLADAEQSCVVDVVGVNLRISERREPRAERFSETESGSFDRASRLERSDGLKVAAAVGSEVVDGGWSVGRPIERRHDDDDEGRRHDDDEGRRHDDDEGRRPEATFDDSVAADIRR